MSGHSDWHVTIDIFGDEEITFARANLNAPHFDAVGHGAARRCPGLQRDPLHGDTAAVCAALEDLARQLGQAPHPDHVRSA